MGQRPAALLTVAALAAGALAGCTGGPSNVTPHGATPGSPRSATAPVGDGAGTPLAAGDSCAPALAELRRAAKEAVGPYGFPGQPFPGPRPEPMTGARTAFDAAPDAGPPAYSGTTVQENGVDEADRVKTDGRRIVSVTDGVLHVVDVRTRAETGRITLSTGPRDAVALVPPDLLLRGDRLLVIPLPSAKGDLVGPAMTLVDLAGPPRVVGRYRIDGTVLGARQVGGTARIVLRSTPLVKFAAPPGARAAEPADRLAANQAAIDRAPAEAWQPRYEVTDGGGHTTAGRVPCRRIVRPAGDVDGGSLVTVLTFDLSKPLDDGDPVTVLTDADTVYATPTTLYVTADTWRRSFERRPVWLRPARRPLEPARTLLAKFATPGAGTPRLVATGAVDGQQVNRYALSEWQDHLRIATTALTTRWPVDSGGPTSSAVRVLRQDGGRLVEAGSVGGLGPRERIMAVRYAGPTAYVVTFRQADPLYVVDLREPARPRLKGELKITGYSSYLHVMADDRMIGIGQEATERGVPTGTQVALFDVRDPTHPVRLARYHVPGAGSAAETDPHAFLYWPADGTVVVPLTAAPASGGIIEGDQPSRTVAVVLRLAGTTITEVGRIAHPAPPTGPDVVRASIVRSLIAGDALWTVSDAGLLASSESSAATVAWIPWQ